MTKTANDAIFDYNSILYRQNAQIFRVSAPPASAMPQKSCPILVVFVFLTAPAAFSQDSTGFESYFSLPQLKPTIIWCISALALALSIAAFFLPPARRAFVSAIVLAALASVGIWKNWHSGIFDLLSGAASFSTAPETLRAIAVLSALGLATLFLISTYLLVITWGRGGYLLMGLTSVVGVWGLLAHVGVVSNSVVWQNPPREGMGTLGFFLSTGASLGFVLSGLVIAFGGGGSKAKAADKAEPAEESSAQSSQTTATTEQKPQSPAKPLPQKTPPAKPAPKPIPVVSPAAALPKPAAPIAPTPPKPNLQADPPSQPPQPVHAATTKPEAKPHQTALPKPSDFKAPKNPAPSVAAKLAASPSIPSKEHPPKPNLAVAPEKPKPAPPRPADFKATSKTLTSTATPRPTAVSAPTPDPVPSPPAPSPAIPVPAPAVPKPSEFRPPSSTEPKLAAPGPKPKVNGQSIDQLRKHQQDRIRAMATPKTAPTLTPAQVISGVAQPKVAPETEVAPELERSTNENSGQPSISWKMSKGVWSRG